MRVCHGCLPVGVSKQSATAVVHYSRLGQCRLAAVLFPRLLPCDSVPASSSFSLSSRTSPSALAYTHTRSSSAHHAHILLHHTSSTRRPSPGPNHLCRRVCLQCFLPLCPHSLFQRSARWSKGLSGTARLKYGYPRPCLRHWLLWCSSGQLQSSGILLGRPFPHMAIGTHHWNCQLRLHHEGQGPLHTKLQRHFQRPAKGGCQGVVQRGEWWAE